MITKTILPSFPLFLSLSLFAEVSVATDAVTNEETSAENASSTHIYVKVSLSFVLKILFHPQNKKWQVKKNLWLIDF